MSVEVTADSDLAPLVSDVETGVAVSFGLFVMALTLNWTLQAVMIGPLTMAGLTDGSRKITANASDLASLVSDVKEEGLVSLRLLDASDVPLGNPLGTLPTIYSTLEKTSSWEKSLEAMLPRWLPHSAWCSLIKGMYMVSYHVHPCPKHVVLTRTS